MWSGTGTETACSVSPPRYISPPGTCGISSWPRPPWRRGYKFLEQVDGLYLAGGFGTYIDPGSAMAIGMLPPVLAGKVRPLGNTALAGAAALALGYVTGGNAPLVAAALGFCSILTAASSLVYGIFSFLEREKNYILAKASLIAAGILVVLWLAVIFIAL